MDKFFKEVEDLQLGLTRDPSNQLQEQLWQDISLYARLQKLMSQPVLNEYNEADKYIEDSMDQR